MYVVDSSARKATITLTGEEVAVKFPCTYSVFGIKGDSMLLYPKSGMAQGDDGVYDTAEGDGSVIMCMHYQVDTVYIKGTGDCVIWAGNSTLDNPFKVGGKGGGGSGGDNTHYKGTTTTAISNGSTTNPITIDGEEYTAVFGDIVVYNYTEFVFDGTTWSEFGRPFDTTPTSGSANAVTSDGIKTALDTKQNIMQYAAMPTITSSMLGKVVQYVGVSDSNYNQGWNYVAVSDGAAEPTYSWQALMDSVPTSGSNNPITSGAVYSRTPWVKGAGAGSAFGGQKSSANGGLSVAYGYYATANGYYSAAFGANVSADQYNMLACGKNNKSRTGDLFNIGNGTNNGAGRSNIVEVNSTEMNVNGDIQKNGVSLPTPYTTMPTITAAMLGQIAMYVGTTDANYTQGWFYIASSDGAAEPTYSWVSMVDATPTSNSKNFVTSDGIYAVTPWIRQLTGSGACMGISASASGATSVAVGYHSTSRGKSSLALGYYAETGSSAHYSASVGTYTNTTNTNMLAIGKYNRSREGDLFNIGNGNGNARSNIVEVNHTSLNVNGDIQRDGVGIDDYTTTERKIGKWIDGSNLYQRTFEVTGLTESDQWVFNNNILGTSNIDIKDFKGYTEWSDGTNTTRFDLNFYLSNGIHSLCLNSTSDLAISLNHESTSLVKAVITIKYTKISEQTLNANLIPSDNPFNVSVMELSETPTSNEEPTDEMR